MKIVREDRNEYVTQMDMEIMAKQICYHYKIEVEDDEFMDIKDIYKIIKENKELKQKVKLLNEMNEDNYNKYCEALKKIKSLETKYWVRNVKSKNIIEDYGNMTLDEIKQFGKQFIGNKTYFGFVFDNIDELYSDIRYIKEVGLETWYLGNGEDIIISEVI